MSDSNRNGAPVDAQPPSANAPPGGNTVEDAAAPSPAPEDAPAPVSYTHLTLPTI